MRSASEETYAGNILSLNVADRMFLMTFEQNKLDFDEYLGCTLLTPNLGFIIKIAHANKNVESICKKDCHNLLWDKAYAELGLNVSLFFHKDIRFYAHGKSNKFDLVRGIFFYYEACKARENLVKDYTPEEIFLLRKAGSYNSVHAIQRYNQYCYLEIAKGILADKQKETFREVIENCNKLRTRYGSYAYMMLAEAYLRYAMWHTSKADEVHAEGCMHAAITACDYAEKYLKLSEHSIHNASLGEGLKTSNSLGLETPSLAKEYITAWWCGYQSEVRHVSEEIPTRGLGI